MPGYRKWETSKEKVNKYNIGDDAYKTNTWGIASVDIALIVISLIIIITVGILALKNYSHIVLVNANISRQEMQIKENKNKLAYLNNIKSSGDIIESAYEESILFIPDEDDEGQIISFLNKCADITGSELMQIEFKSREVTKEYDLTKMPFNVLYKCTYGQMIEILNLLNDNERAYIIDKTVIVKESGDENILRVEFTAHCLYKQY